MNRNFAIEIMFTIQLTFFVLLKIKLIRGNNYIQFLKNYY